jgi:signal transduction histidine kinase/CheY-like chemotaxis protein/HPt (histidine-containing phosphotransfer) domain-containing protein
MQRATRRSTGGALKAITIWRAILVVAGVLLLLNLVQLFGVLNERGRAELDAVREDTVWAAYQLEREAARLHEDISRAPVDVASWLADISQRFDILYSRTGILTEGQVAARFGETPTLATLVTRVRNGIVALAPTFDELASGLAPSDEARLAIAEKVRVIEDDAAQLLIATNARHSEVKVAERAQVKGYYEQMAWSAGALGTVFALFIVMLAIQLRHIRRLNDSSLRAARDAEAGSRAKSAFLATMSHEIRTPLNGILGMADLLADSNLDAGQRQKVGVIRSAGDLLLDVINDVLDFSKLESGTVELAVSSFRLDEVVGVVAEMMRPRARSKHLSFEVSCPNVNVTTDAARLRQILVNLVGNAIKFTEVGKVQLNASIGEGRDGASTLVIKVSDSGIGMSASTISKLFQEFVQGDPSISRRFGGTGLGLAICKRLIETMGGAIEVTSREGEGSTFTLSLPCEVSQAATVSSPAAPAHRRTGRILLVEDNPINQQVAEGLLQKIGMSIEIAANGALALEAVGRQRFDLIFMDMQMPVMDGLTATRAIRSTGDETPIVGLTANAFASDRAECLAAGMDDFVSKPVTRAKLEEAIDRAAANYQLPGDLPAKPHPSADIDSAQRDALIAELGEDQYEELVGHFISDGHELLAEAASVPGSEASMRALHSLKGMARTLGYTAIGDLAAAAELESRAAKAADLGALRLALDNVVNEKSAA